MEGANSSGDAVWLGTQEALAAHLDGQRVQPGFFRALGDEDGLAAGVRGGIVGGMAGGYWGSASAASSKSADGYYGIRGKHAAKRVMRGGGLNDGGLLMRIVKRKRRNF